MIKTILIFPGLFILIKLLACSGTVSDFDNENDMIYQIPGCQNNVLAKTTINDSCFNYSFHQNLILDFCVSSNCCPDSNRFDLMNNISSDTIYVTVIDTAAHLCNCICNYNIHFEKFNLPLDSYLFYCKYNDEILYAIRLHRTKHYN